MAIISANTPVTVPSATYGVYWIKSIVINNDNVSAPKAFVSFYIGNEQGVQAPGTNMVSYNVDIMDKITKGDTDLATLFGTLVAKAGAMAIADGKLAGTIA